MTIHVPNDDYALLLGEQADDQAARERLSAVGLADWQAARRALQHMALNYACSIPITAKKSGL